MKAVDCWIETYTGKRIHLLNPQPEEIDIIDIAQSLSQQCRFTGMTSLPYNVADHSIRVSAIVPPELMFPALLHDASEAYLSDISRGLKHALILYQDIEHIVQRAIYDKYGISELSFGATNIIKEADNILLMTEGRDLMPRANIESWNIKEKPLTATIIPRTSQMSFASFIGQFNKLCSKEHVCRFIPPYYPETISRLDLEV